MKKTIPAIIALSLILVLTGCGNNDTSVRSESQTSGVKDVLEAGIAEADSKNNDSNLLPVETTTEYIPSETTMPGIPETSAAETRDIIDIRHSADASVDVDLTVLSKTMVYSEVLHMMTVPEDYLGKTVKMKGLFAIYYDEATDFYYFACIIQDATACCSQGIEFVLEGDHTYPDDYPELGSEITVTGVFDTYEEAGIKYCTLRNAFFN